MSDYVVSVWRDNTGARGISISHVEPTVGEYNHTCELTMISPGGVETFVEAIRKAQTEAFALPEVKGEHMEQVVYEAPDRW